MSNRLASGLRRVRRPGRWSIGAYILVLIVMQTVLFTAAFEWWEQHDLAEARAKATQIASSNARQAAGFIAKAVEDSRSIMALEGAQPGYAGVFANPASCSLTAGGVDVFLNGDLSIVRPDGTVACSSLHPSGELPGPGYRGSAWLAKVGTTPTPLVVGPIDDPATKKRSLIVATPIAPKGFLVLSLDVASLGTGLNQAASLSRPRPLFVVMDRRDMSVVARSDSSSVGGSLRGTAFAVPMRSGAVVKSIDGKQRISAEASVDGLGWDVYAGVSTIDAYADAHRRIYEQQVIGTLLLLISCLVGVVIYRRIARPVRSLSAAVDEAAQGNLDAIVPWGPVEVRGVAERFNSFLEIRAQAEQTLRDAYDVERHAVEELRELDEMKSAFLMGISHELRTPLTSVIGYSSLLEDSSNLSTEETADFAHVINDSGKRLERLLADLLDVERLGRGTLEPRRRMTDVRELVRHVLEYSGLDGRVRLDIAKETMADIDSALLERIVENLVLNAKKHTPSGTCITVTGEVTDDALLLTVSDDGPGVPDDLKEAIFEPFRQNAPAHQPGTGIGLTLVAQFAKLHGGSAWVEDRPGGGAAFRVLLPSASATVVPLAS